MLRTKQQLKESSTHHIRPTDPKLDGIPSLDRHGDTLQEVGTGFSLPCPLPDLVTRKAIDLVPITPIVSTATGVKVWLILFCH